MCCRCDRTQGRSGRWGASSAGRGGGGEGCDWSDRKGLLRCRKALTNGWTLFRGRAYSGVESLAPAAAFQASCWRPLYSCECFCRKDSRRQQRTESGFEEESRSASNGFNDVVQESLQPNSGARFTTQIAPMSRIISPIAMNQIQARVMSSIALPILI